MDIKNFGAAVFWGFCDSFRGVSTLFYLDNELQRRRLSRLSPMHSHSPIRRRQSEPRDQTPVRTTQRHEEVTVLTRIFHCGFLNGAVFLLSIVLFEFAFLPLMQIAILLIFGKDSVNGQVVWYWTELVIRITFHSIWVVPLFALSKFVNNLWFQDIGQSAYRYSRGRSNVSLSLSKSVADFIFSTVVETLFLVQAIAMTYCPIYYLGYSLYFIHLCLLYSLYAFEYQWGEMGWEIHRRLTCIESNWPYFIGFGMPLVLLTQLSDSLVVNGCIFAILFPFFIISANEANPVVESCPRIKFFSPVIALSNSLFSVLGRGKKPKTQVAVVQRPAAQLRR